MEGIINKLTDPVYVSAAAAVISAFFAGLTVVFARRLSTREKLDILKAEILRYVSIVENRHKWIATGKASQAIDGDGIGPDARRLGDLLGSKYKSKKWSLLIPAAIEELRHEGYDSLLGI